MISQSEQLLVQPEQVADSEKAINDENDDDYEEVLVVATFQDFEESFITKNSEEIIFSNIDSSNPSCVIDGRFKFRGNYENSLGTNYLTNSLTHSFIHLLYEGTHLILKSDESHSIIGQTDCTLVFKLEKIEQNSDGTRILEPEQEGLEPKNNRNINRATKNVNKNEDIEEYMDL